METSTAHALLKDPLSELTRKERRNLLVVSAISIAMVKTGLIPTKIAAVGVEFSQTDRAILLKVLAAVILYFFIAFLLYALSDFLAWRLNFYSAVRELWLKRKKQGIFDSDDEDVLKEIMTRFIGRRFFLFAVTPISILRTLFEFLAPVIIAIYAIMILF